MTRHDHLGPWLPPLLAVFGLAASPAWSAPSAATDYVEHIRRGSLLDAEMKKATAQARSSLPVFWRHFADHGADDHFLEVDVPTSSGMVEGIWVRVLSRKGAKLSGELADEPDRMPGRHMHSKVTFTEAQIADWTYSEGGRHYGYFTTRVLAKRHPEDAERLKAELWENPLPPQPASKH